MCLPGQPATGAAQVPATAAEAAAMARAALAWLAGADAAALTTSEQAECLRVLEQAESAHTAARASVLAAFRAAGGCRDDGHGSARTWLKWQTRITDGAATGAMGWMRRLADHPLVRGALADGQISASWAKQICKWTDKVPAQGRDDADSILLHAARGGMDLDDLGGLAEEIRRQTAEPDTDGPDDGFDDRSVSLDTTFGGAGKLRGDLTPSATAALTAVLDSLGKRAGPEDLRSVWQRRHDALEEACRRLIAASCLPGRAGQPTQILLHMDLDRLRGMPGASDAEATFPGPIAPPGAECDATIVPVVTGHVDPVALDRLTALVRGSNDYGGAAARRELAAEAARHPHHLRPRRKGGKTSLVNLALLCPFHHLIAVHRWGWQIVLNPDGTVTVTSPDGDRILHSHSPPTRAA